LVESHFAKLSGREIEILRLLGSGKSLSEIAALINASYKTVANTSSIIRQKLGVRSASELVHLVIDSCLA
jgi:two-component system invasion response regulator UvrY